MYLHLCSLAMPKYSHTAIFLSECWTLTVPRRHRGFAGIMERALSVPTSILISHAWVLAHSYLPLRVLDTYRPLRTPASGWSGRSPSRGWCPGSWAVSWSDSAGRWRSRSQSRSAAWPGSPPENTKPLAVRWIKVMGLTNISFHTNNICNLK